MRILIKGLILTCAVAGLATLGTAGSAHASRALCGQKPLRADLPNVLVVTCGEAEGDQRRGRSIVVNSSNRTIEVTSLKALISSPDYGTTDCGEYRLTPGTQVTCITPWVTNRPPFSPSTSVFSLVQAVDGEHRFVSHVSSFVATF